MFGPATGEDVLAGDGLAAATAAAASVDEVLLEAAGEAMRAGEAPGDAAAPPGDVEVAGNGKVLRDAERGGDAAVAAGDETVAPGDEPMAPGDGLLALGDETVAPGDAVFGPAPGEVVPPGGELVPAPPGDDEVTGDWRVREDAEGDGDAAVAPGDETMAPGDTIVAPGDEPDPLDGAAGDVPVVLEDADGDDDAVLKGGFAGDAGDVPGDPPEAAGVVAVPDEDGDERGDGTAPAKPENSNFRSFIELDDHKTRRHNCSYAVSSYDVAPCIASFLKLTIRMSASTPTYA